MKYGVKDLVKRYGNLEVLDRVSIQFEENKITCILGPSGCGKTTLLNIIVGSIAQDDGEVIGFDKEDMGFVYQEDRLIEWKNVRDNIEFVLRDRMDRKTREEIIYRYLKLVGLYEYANYYPAQLSGGMRQRISILRAFAYPSRILIMDEPFKSLDINSKQTIMEFTLKLRELKGKTCILVTHDIEEALTLGDNIVILSQRPARVKRIVENLHIADDNDDNAEGYRSTLRGLIEGEFID